MLTNSLASCHTTSNSNFFTFPTRTNIVLSLGRFILSWLYLFFCVASLNFHILLALLQLVFGSFISSANQHVLEITPSPYLPVLFTLPSFSYHSLLVTEVASPRPRQEERMMSMPVIVTKSVLFKISASLCLCSRPQGTVTEDNLTIFYANLTKNFSEVAFRKLATLL